MSSETKVAPLGANAAPKHSLGGLVKHSAIYSLVPILQRAIGFLLIRFFTAKLNTAQWGVQSITDLLVVAATQAAGMNLLAAMTRFYFDYEDEKDRGEVISSAVIALSIVSWIAIGVAIFFRASIASLMFEVNDPKLVHDDLPNCLAIALATIPLAMSSEAGFRYLQVLKRSSLYTTLRTVKTFVELGLKVWFVVGLEWGVAGFLLSVLLGELMTSVLLTGGILVRLGPRVSWHKLRPMVKYALPLIPVGLLQMGLHQMDKVMLKALGPAELAMSWVGVYGLGYTAGFMVQQMAMGSFMQAWQPSIFAVADPIERGKLQSRVNTYAMLFVGAASIGLIVFAREIVGLISGQPDYLDALRVVPWVAAGYVFYGLYALGQVTLLAEKRTWPLLWINASTLAVNLALDAILIPRMGELGYVGPAIATLVTFILQAALVAWVAHGRIGSAPLEWKRIAAVLIAVLVAMTATLVFEEHACELAWSRPAVEVLKAGVISAMLAFFWFALLSRDERGAVRERLARLPAIGRLF